MQFKVPQDVLREDKIVGFLTLRQLIISTLGGGLAYVLYTVLGKQYVLSIWLPPVLFVLLVTGAFAFLRYQELPFEKLILYLIEFQTKPRQRFWEKMQGDVYLSALASYTPEAKKEKTEDEMSSQDRHSKLTEISRIVDSHPKT